MIPSSNKMPINFSLKLLIADNVIIIWYGNCTLGVIDYEWAGLEANGEEIIVDDRFHCEESTGAHLMMHW